MKDVCLKEIMASPVVTVRAGDSFSKVAEKLRAKGIRHLPVLDDHGRVVGLITQRDLYRTLSPRIAEDGFCYDPAMLDGFILRRVMTPDPHTLGPEDSVAQAVGVMAMHKYGCIPVVDAEKKIVGIVTETDILKFVARTML